MLDVAVGIVIFLFVVLGLREGIVKSLGSVAAVFVGLFLASSTLSFLAKAEPRFAEPSFLGAIIIFLLVWALSYVVIDILLTLLFKKIINIIVLGPVDKVGGTLIGGFKGLLISGIILQLALAMPISAETKKTITSSPISRFAIAAYQWSYPYAKKLMPMVNNLMQQNNIVEKVNEQENLKDKTKDLSPNDFIKNIDKYEKVKTEQEKKIMKLLKDQKLLHGAPIRRVEDVK